MVRPLASRTDVLSARMLRVIGDLAGDWRRLDERIETLSREIETIARQDAGCDRLERAGGRTDTLDRLPLDLTFGKCT